jgi:hypothetical protein
MSNLREYKYNFFDLRSERRGKPLPEDVNEIPKIEYFS